MASGTWNVDASSNWGTSTNWVSNTIADGANSTASFTNNITTTRTVTLNTSRTIGNLTFSDAGASGSAWVLTNSGGSTLTLSNTTSPTLNVITPTTITGSFSFIGTGGFTKSGTAALRFDAQGSTLSGTIAINAGIFQSGAVNTSGTPTTNVFPSATAWSIGASGVWQMYHSNNTAFTISAPVTGSGIVQVAQSSTATFALNGITFANLSGFTGIMLLYFNDNSNNIRSLVGVKQFPTGGGSFLFDCQTSAAVPSPVTTLTIPSDATAGATSAPLWLRLLQNATVTNWTAAVYANQSTGAMDFQSGIYREDGGNNFTNTPTVTFTLDGINTELNTISGQVRCVSTGVALALAKDGAGRWVLSNNTNSYTGGTTIRSGALRATANAAFGTSSVLMTGVLNPTLELSGSVSVSNAVTAIGTISGVAGANTLSGSVTLAGTTTIEATAGSLALTSGTPIGGTANLTLGGAADVSVAQAIQTTTGTLTKSGAGTTTLSNTDSTFSGAVSVSAGTLDVAYLANSGTNSSIGTGATTPAITFTGGTIRHSGNATSLTNRALSMSGTGASFGLASTGNAPVTYTDTTALSATSSTLTFSGTNTSFNTLAAPVGGSIALSKSGAGKWIMTGANTTSGSASVTGGTLMAANNSYTSKLFGSGTVTVGTGGRIQTGSDGTQAGRCTYTNLSMGGTVSEPARLRIGGSAVNPTVVMSGNLVLPTGSDKATFDLSANVFKTPGTYTLIEFTGSAAVTGGTVTSNVQATGLATGRTATFTYNNLSTPKTVTVTIS